MNKILVVEDDPAVQRVLRRLFEAEEFAITVTADGKSALDTFRSSPPSAVILDLRLPDILKTCDSEGFINLDDTEPLASRSGYSTAAIVNSAFVAMWWHIRSR
ncbi:MAG TPA: response regulator [Terriglobia bacterium]|nr:response regulator [Terriglobia bacterium]